MVTQTSFVLYWHCIHRSSLPPTLPHAFAHVLCSGAYARLKNRYDPLTHPRTSDVTGMDWGSEGFRACVRESRHRNF